MEAEDPETGAGGACSPRQTSTWLGALPSRFMAYWRGQALAVVRSLCLVAAVPRGPGS